MSEKSETTHQSSLRFGVRDDESWRRSYMRLPAPVAEVGGFPVKAFGRTYVYSVSPDFQTDVLLQRGNSRPRHKIIPKKSWEIRENHVGSMVSYQPRIPPNDFQPFLSINLIDGDPETGWCSRGEAQPDVAPAWVRVDLAAEESLREIVLVPRKDAHPWPQQLTIKLSCDAWHWIIVYESGGAAPTPGEPVRVRLPENTRAKQLWIIGNQLPTDETYKFGSDHVFSFAGVQAIDEYGEDVALASRGAGVTTSSTNYGYGSAWDYYDLLWPVQYDLGAKWMRLSCGNGPFDHDSLQWRFVEQERATYITDEKTDLALAEAAANGYRIVVILCCGNWLYTSQPQHARLDRRTWPPPYDPRIPDRVPPAPVTREGFDAYKNWVRFMVEHHKGRVAYWEVFNEPVAFGWEVIADYQERVRVYCDLVQEVVPIIRETDPEARICLAGMAGIPGPAFTSPDWPDWLRSCLEQGVAPLVDAFGWHQGAVQPGGPGWDAYPQAVREFKRDAEAKGFRGIYMASEWGLHDQYPLHSQSPSGIEGMTELRKAKDLARVFLLNLGLGVIPFYCNTWIEITQYAMGLFRNTFAADPLSPAQPGAGYYVMRTLCTVMAEAGPTELAVEFSETAQKFDNYNFALPDGSLLVAIWLRGVSVDKHPGVTTDVVVSTTRCRSVTGVDLLNGFEQVLDFAQGADRVHIPGLIVRDYPLVLRLTGAGEWTSSASFQTLP